MSLCMQEFKWRLSNPMCIASGGWSQSHIGHAPRHTPHAVGGGGVWVANFPTRQILGPSVRPHHPPPGNTAEYFSWLSIRTIAPIIRISKYEGPGCTGVFEKSFQPSILNIENPPWKSLTHCKRRRKCALITPATAYRRKYGGICKGLAEKTMGWA